jgi:hypothetical protein
VNNAVSAQLVRVFRRPRDEHEALQKKVLNERKREPQTGRDAARIGVGDGLEIMGSIN